MGMVLLTTLVSLGEMVPANTPVHKELINYQEDSNSVLLNVPLFSSVTGGTISCSLQE